MRANTPRGLMAILVLSWGLVWPASKIALHYSPPMMFAALRVVTSGLLLLAWIRVRPSPHVASTPLRVNLLLSFFNVSLFYGLQMLALRQLSAGLLSILVYIQPILSAVLARFWLNESLRLAQLAGFALGFSGIVAVSVSGLATHAPWLSILVGLGAGVSWSLGTILYKKYARSGNPIRDVAIQLVTGGTVLSVLAIGSESLAAIHWVAPFWGSWLFSSVIGTALAWVLWARLLQGGTVSGVTVWTFLVPVVSTVISVLWMGEPNSLGLWVGALGVMAGTYLVNRPAAPAISGPSP
ncbi:MAG: DMT family transporter [Firmicutes bacterium]|nr:DMT family transporter [Bacillota bacterium]